jgi:hypothetical protein
VSPEDWIGLTNPISPNGLDFSRYRYVEIWVNDFRADHTLTRCKLHLDFGEVSEDAFWDRFAPPNGRLDTEDKNLDGKLDAGNLETGEDTGLDGLFDVQEPGYDPNANPDPDEDDYYYDQATPTDYSGINNYEGNGEGLPNARPDTEDLDRDNYLEMYNNYFEATLDLSTTARYDSTTGIAIATDVREDYPGATLREGNGWRLFRIPITADAFARYGSSASWQDIQHVRLWMEGMDSTTYLQIGGIEVVGNRWVAEPVSDSLAAQGVTLTVTSLNNKDNRDIYVPPPIEIGNATGTTDTRREQSLALTYTGLDYGDSLLAFKTTFDPNSGLGWTQYGTIQVWVHGDDNAASQPLRAFARFGPDTVNYYEYSAPVLQGWQQWSIPMAILSQLKQSGKSTTVRIDSTSSSSGAIYTVVGNPSFTRILRTSFGVTAYGPGGTVPPGGIDGQIWINELSLTDVNRENGGRGDVIVQATFADVLSMNVNFAKQNENFMRVGSATASQGSGVNTTALGFSSTLALDKMMPTSGVQLPLRLSVQKLREVPKYQTGSDIILTSEKSDEDTRESERRSLDLSYRRTGARKGIAKYTIDALNASMAYAKSNAINTSSIDSSVSFNTGVGYDLPLGGGGFTVAKKLKVNILPDVVGLTGAWRSSRTVAYARLQTDSSDAAVLRTNAVDRFLTLNANASWTPLSSVRLRLAGTSLRNMLLHQPGALGLNKGTEVDRTRRLELNYAPRWLSLLSLNLVMNGSYHQVTGPSLRISTSDPTGLMNIENRGSMRVTGTIPLSRLAQRATPRPGAKGSSGSSAALAPLKLIASKLQDIQGSFNLERNTVITRVSGSTDFWFTTGFTSDPGNDIQEAANSVATSNRSYTSGANTTIRPTQNLTLDIRADQQLTYTEPVTGARRLNRVSFPDMKARWLYLERVLGLQKSLSSLQLNSGFNVRKDESGPESGPVELKNTTTAWAPLLGWDLVFRNGLRATVNTAVGKTKNIDSRISGITGTRETSDTQIRFTKVYPASKGFKLPFSKKPIRLRNDLNLNLNLSLQGATQTIARPGLPPATEVNTRTLNLSSSTGYNFTQAISGGFEIGFTQNQDLKSAVTRNGIKLALNGQFRF